MKAHTFISLAALVGLVSAHADTVLLNDNFNDDALDSSLWTSSSPFSDSSVEEGGGTLRLTNGGGILSNVGYVTPIEVIFSFSFTGSLYDSFRVMTRADAFYPGGYAIKHGTAVSFRIQEDTGNLFGNVALEDSSGVLTTGTFALSPNTSYTGRLVDTGSAFGFYWGDDLNPFLSATSADHYGDKIGSFNREGSGNNSWISAGSQMSIGSITVVDLGGNDNWNSHRVPDASATTALFGLGMLILELSRRLRKGS